LTSIDIVSFLFEGGGQIGVWCVNFGSKLHGHETKKVLVANWGVAYNDEEISRILGTKRGVVYTYSVASTPVLAFNYCCRLWSLK